MKSTSVKFRQLSKRFERLFIRAPAVYLPALLYCQEVVYNLTKRFNFFKNIDFSIFIFSVLPF